MHKVADDVIWHEDTLLGKAEGVVSVSEAFAADMWGSPF